MKKINTKHNNNYSIAQQLFDEIVVWSAQKQPKEDLPSFIGEIEKILDNIGDKGYKKTKNSCCEG